MKVAVKTSKMTISLEKALKEAFMDRAYKLGTNPTNLLSMMMTNFVNTGEVYFKIKPELDLEIEAFSDEEYKDLLSDKVIQKNLAELESIIF